MIAGQAANRARAVRALRRHAVAYAFLGPAMIVLVVFRIRPIFDAFQVSFTDLNALSAASRPVGLSNYFSVVSDPEFQHAFATTIQYVAIQVPFQTVLALALALLLQRRVRGLSIVRSAVFLPVCTSMVVVALIWNLIYHPNIGLLNAILGSIGVAPHFWLGDVSTALAAIAGMTIWKEVGFSTIIFLAGLQSIPAEIYDAARVDGAGAWASLRRITLPLLRRTSVFVVVVGTLSASQLFTPVAIMTGGGPRGSTESVVFYLWHQAFISLNLGYAAAIALVFLVVILVAALLQFSLSRSTFEY